MTAGARRLDASAADRDLRLDQFLARQLPELSRSRIKALILGGHVRCGGEVPRVGLRLKGSERVEVTVPPLEAAIPVAEALPLSKLFEDRQLLVLDKAAGMVVHPGAGHRGGTLVNALLHHVADLQGVGGALRPGLVHRLDKDTSGVLVVAKNDLALRALQAAFKSREVEKTYLALVVGRPPPEGSFRTLYGRHPTQRVRFSGRVKSGKPAVTHFRLREPLGELSLVEVILETGRTHQIRVHFAEAGFPLVSDALYGGRKAQRPALIGRQALHAWRLSFPHPATGRRLTFEAPIPADLRHALDAARGG